MLVLLALICVRPADAQVQQDISLEQGWNAISFRVRPTSTKFSDIFRAIGTNVTLVKDGLGNVYSPDPLIDSLSPWDSTKAYLVLARSSTTLRIDGVALDPARIQLTLTRGWNFIPYLPSAPMAVKEVFAPIQDKVVLVKNAAGQIYSPSRAIDTIVNMAPGQGYYVYVTDAATLTYSKSISTAPAPPPPTPQPPAEGATACLASPNAHSVTEYGAFTPGQTDNATVKINTATLNKAIEQVGLMGGGSVCLPKGDYYLSPADTTKLYSAAVYINRNNITLWGAGKYAAQGGTALHTRSRYNLINGQVMRGVGIWIKGTTSVTAPRQNITFRDFELDGGAGYTGSFGWPANPVTGDGWDVTHKGIMLSSNDNVHNVTLQDMYVHSYKGEVIYAGGGGLGDLFIRRTKVEDTNASTINFTANFIIEDSEFGRSSIWNEVGVHLGKKRGIFRNNYFHDAARFGLNFAQGDRSPQPYLVEGNKFERCGAYAVLLAGGIEGPLEVRNNEFVDCAMVQSSYSDNNNIIFENNKVTLSGKKEGFYIQGGVKNMIIRNNHITAEVAAGLCCSALENVVVEGNTFIGSNPKEYAPPRSGERPVFRNNTYSVAPWHKTLFVTDHKFTPIYEIGAVRAEVANVTIELETNFYADGQVIKFIGGSADKPVKFAAGSTSYYVAQDRFLTGANVIWMKYNKALSRWEEIPAPAL